MALELGKHGLGVSLIASAGPQRETWRAHRIWGSAGRTVQKFSAGQSEKSWEKWGTGELAEPGKKGAQVCKTQPIKESGVYRAGPLRNSKNWCKMWLGLKIQTFGTDLAGPGLTWLDRTGRRELLGRPGQASGSQNFSSGVCS